MMNKKSPFRRHEVIAVSVILLGAGSYFGFRPTAAQMTKKHQEAELVRKIQAPSRAPANAEMKTERALLPPKKEVDPFKGTRHMDLVETLKEYKGLSKKVLMTEVERARMQEILEDRGVLKNLKDQLVHQGAIAKNSESNQDAVKLLLEALRFSESSQVEALLQEIISDRGVENGDLPMADRERMAEAKAEIMYGWSSVDYSAAAKIQQALPGTVSTNIWKNVKSMQAQNDADSSQVAKRFATSGSHYRGDDAQ